MALETAERTQDAGHEVLFSSGRDNTGDNSFWRELEDSSLSVRELTWLKRAPGYWDLFALWELWVMFRRVRPDCVHLHTSKAGTLGAVAARLAGVPGVVYSSHGHLFHPDLELQDVDLEGVKWYFYYWMRRVTVALSDRVVALSRQDYSEQLDLKLGEERDFVVIPNGVDYSAFQPASNTVNVPELSSGKTTEEGPVLLHVGRLVREKGQETLIRAVDNLRQQYPDIRCLIVGEGPYRHHLESLISELELGNCVFLTGTRENVVPYYHVSDVFCFPSQYESQGIAVMEAMAAGLPVVATTEGGLSELVKPGRTALTIDPRAEQELSRAVDRILSNPDLKETITENARSLIEETYTLETHAERTLRLYESVAATQS